MNLCIDIGNTRLKAGLFAQNQLVETAFFAPEALGEVADWARDCGAENAIFCTVGQAQTGVSEVFQHFKTFLELDHRTALPFENRYQTPETLGKDRLAGAAGAIANFPGENVLTVDCGTCIKYDVVTASGAFLGGNIAPGAAMRLRAMHHFTARLPEATFSLPDTPIGHSTETALQNGGLLGAALEIEGFARKFARKFRGNFRVILTGGDAEFFAKQLKIKNLSVEPNLVLCGLNSILNHNLK